MARTISRYWNGALAAVIAASLVLQIILLATGGKDANSGSTEATVGFATKMLRLFSYFTVESNIIVMVVAATLVVLPDRDGSRWRVARLDALLGITITGIVFETVLADQVQLSGWAMVANVGFHYIAPWAAVIGWIAFGPRPRITTWRTVALAFIWPVAWIVYTFAHGAVSDWYPYPFLDVGKKGYPTALFNTSLVLVMGLVLAAAFKALDRFRPAPAPT